jgi:protein SCO1
VGAATGAALHVVLRPASARAGSSFPVLHGQAVWPAGRRPAPAFVLRDERGRLLSPGAEHGRTLVIAFMDSRCRQVCPVEGRALAQALDALPAAERPVLLVVSVDPWADTAVSARAAARKWGFPGEWHWLLGTRRELAPVWRDYRIYVRRTTGDVVHSDAIYLVDRRGYERAGYLFPFEPGLVRHDLGVIAGGGA